MNAKRPKWLPPYLSWLPYSSLPTPPSPLTMKLLCKSTESLLLANRKTLRQFSQLVHDSYCPQLDIERTFEEVKDYELLEKCITLASSQNINVIDAAAGMRTVIEKLRLENGT